jgi:hypothetical protein
MLDVFRFSFSRMKFQQRLLHRLRHYFPHFSFAMKLHFALGRMNVHVHGGGIDFQKQATDRIPSLHQRCVITFQQGKVDAAIFDRPPVYEDVLVLSCRA